jgi:hypothetical protein
VLDAVEPLADLESEAGSEIAGRPLAGLEALGLDLFLAADHILAIPDQVCVRVGDAGGRVGVLRLDRRTGIAFLGHGRGFLIAFSRAVRV